MIGKIKGYLTDPGFIVATIVVTVVVAWFVLPAINKFKPAQKSA